jgi:hypothetical protein
MTSIGHNGGPALDQPRKVIRVVMPVHIQTIVKHAWGASYQAAKLSEKELVKAWAYSHAAQQMRNLTITPKGCIHRRHHHIIPQIADNDRVRIIDDEMERRGLFDLYELDIDIRRSTKP